MAQPQPHLRPGAGFCLQTASAGGSGGKWFLNICKHKLCEMPLGYSGKPVTKDYILAHGIGNMQVPFDMGSFRKLKERADGARHSTFCVDIVFNPLIVQLFMDDDFCNKMAQFRPFVVNLAIKRIDDSIGVKLSTEKVTLVKTMFYKDGEGPQKSVPRELAELPGDLDCGDDYAPAPARPSEDKALHEPLIEDLTPGVNKPALAKGFLNNRQKAGALYGEGGSKEGVVPENAGDPMGWMPKKLRNSCQIVDCNNPEYQEAEKKRKATEESNKEGRAFQDQMAKDMEKWCKMSTPDKWGEDTPDGTGAPAGKYDVDYSRFDRLEDADDPPPVETRDWYYDGKGVRVKGSDAAPSAPARAAGSPEPEAEPAVRRGFLSNPSRPLYPEGGSEQKAPPSEDDMMKDLLSKLGPDALGNPAAAGAEGTPAKGGGLAVKQLEAKAPEFVLAEGTAGALTLTVSVPGLESMADVALDVEGKLASLTFPFRSGFRPLRVELPAEVAPGQARAKFSRKRCQITITLPAAQN